MAAKIVIGLTGNIATGKSLVMRMIQELGATTIDADKLVHQLMRRGGPVYTAIVEEFGKFILDGSEEIDRNKLGRIVFGDAVAMAKLEELTHPGVIQEVQQRIDAAPTPVVALEAIKLFETGLADLCQSTWVVVAPPAMQQKRLMERRKMTPEQAIQRIKAQSPQQEKAAKADVIIDNSGPLAKTWSIVKIQYTKLMQTQLGQTAPALTETEPEAPQPVVQPPAVEIDLSAVSLRRAKRADLKAMIELVAAGTHGAVTPDMNSMMENLFSRAYLVAMAGDRPVGMIGWQTENLVAGLQDFYLLQPDLWPTVGAQILSLVHDEVNKLSCEVSLIFILNKAGKPPVEFLESQGYEQFSANQLIPDWREAAVEWQPEESTLLYKKLREQRIMVPM